MISRYCRWLFAAIGSSLAGIGLVNGIVDPLCAYHAPGAGPLAAYKSRAADRIAKAELARSTPFEAVIIGDSRVLRGFDPRHPALETFGRSGNLGISAGSIYESARMLELCLERHPPQLAIWCFSPELIESDRPDRTNFDFDLSRLNPRLAPVMYHAHNLFGRDVMKASINALKLRWRDRPTEIRDGFEPDHRVFSDPRGLFLSWLPTVRPPLRSDVSPAQLRESLSRIAGCLERAQSRGTRVILVIPPVHAAYLHGMAQIGLWEHYENGKRHLVRLAEERNRLAPNQPPIAVWDFSGFSGFTAEPIPAAEDSQPMTWYLDPLHFRETLGKIVLDRILGDSAEHGEFGVNLSLEILERHLLAQRADRSRYGRQLEPTLRFAERGP